MLFQILKKDMLKRKAINGILFLFITLATVFLASSVNNILIVSKGVSFYMDYANVANLNIILNSDSEKERLSTWLEDKKQNQKITNYDSANLVMLSDKSVQIKKENGWESIISTGASLYLSKKGNVYSKVFDESGADFSLTDNEIALPISFMNSNNLKVGDHFLLKLGNEEKDFVIKVKMKDATFGSDMFGMSRFIVSDSNYHYFEKDASKLEMFFVSTDNQDEIIREINQEQFKTVLNTFTRNMFEMVYSFDMILAALLILIGICLILIAMLVLRFTLIFTMEEQYQEIGILKAIGFRDFGIKKIYLIKYLAIVFLGSILGFLISIPISSKMIESVSKNMIMASKNVNVLVNLLCAILVILIVLVFCYFCTKKLSKISPIRAIRNGESGERYEAKKGLSLYLKKKIPVSLYLACNDIFGHLKRYAVLLITFSISFILISIPLNTLNTMSSREMISKFSINPDSSVYIRSLEEEDEKYLSVKELQEKMVSMKQEFFEKGFDTKLTAVPFYFISYSTPGLTNQQTILTVQYIGDNTDFNEYSKGRAPTLENEVAISEALLKENLWEVGDYVNAVVNGEKRSLLITGTYSDYIQMGKSARINNLIPCEKEMMFDYWALSLDMNTDLSQYDLARKMEQIFPQYEWMTGQELVNQNVGGIQKILESLILPITFLLTLVIMLITLLMEKLFIAREKSELAMLKSLGFRYQTIRAYHLYRMILVAFLSMIVAIPLSFLSNQLMLKPIFKIMGANVKIQVDPLLVYLVFPIILFLGITIATWISTRHIKKIHIRDINNME